MKKEELIEEIKKEIEATKNVLNCEEHFSLYAKGKRIGLEFGWMFAEKLDEPEVPVIPQFVADHIEVRKKVGKRLNVALSESPEVIMSEKMNIAIFEANNIYARAWLDGYTIEKEKMYRVKFAKATKNGDEMYLEKNDGEDAISIDWSSKDFVENEDPNDYLFTEQEIKAIDERYWAFAEEVTDNE